MSTRTRTGVTGIVVGGGRSTRLGTPKPMLYIGGKLVIARIADALRDLCDEMVFVAREGQDDHSPDTAIALRMHVVTDTPPYKGPLAALHAGLKTAVTPLAFITAGDHPFLSKRLAEAMIAAAYRSSEQLESVLTRVGGMVHPLHSVLVVADWLPIVESALENGETSPARVLDRAMDADGPPVSIMTEEEAERHDPRLLSFFDVDTPEQLSIARKLLDTRRVNLRHDPRRGRR